MADARVQTVVSTPEEAEYEQRSLEAAIWTGGRLLIGIVTFAFASLAFAYFYLRSANDEDLWRPDGITAPTSIGAAIFAILVASAAINLFGARRLRLGQSVDWMVASSTALFGGVLAIAMQIYELTRLPFAPGSSGYASCFIGWAALNVALLLASAYWLEILLAKAIRLRATLRDQPTTGVTQSTALFRVSLESCTYFWCFVALLEVLFWLLFYVL